MPKIFEFVCTICEAKPREEWFSNVEPPPDELELECESCKRKTRHERVKFSRNPSRPIEGPYGGGKVLG